MKKYSYLFLGLFFFFLAVYYKNIFFGIGGVVIVFLKQINNLHYTFFRSINNPLSKLFNNRH